MNAPRLAFSHPAGAAAPNRIVNEQLDDDISIESIPRDDVHQEPHQRAPVLAQPVYAGIATEPAVDVDAESDALANALDEYGTTGKCDKAADRARNIIAENQKTIQVAMAEATKIARRLSEQDRQALEYLYACFTNHRTDMIACITEFVNAGKCEQVVQEQRTQIARADAAWEILEQHQTRERQRRKRARRAANNVASTLC